MKTRIILVLVTTVAIASCESREISGSWSNDAAINAEVYGGAQKPTPQPPASDPIPLTSIEFEALEYDFGEIMQGTVNDCTYKFRNTGDHPLTIQNSKASCGCTVSSHPKEPIAPGETSEIKLRYSCGGQRGHQEKSVTVVANTEPSQTILRMKAYVVEKGE